jgi:putative inorganic carbon (HCO3(-)) transporter
MSVLIQILPLGVLAACLLIVVVLVKPVCGLYLLLLVVGLIPPIGMIEILNYRLTPVDLYMVPYAFLWALRKGATGKLRISCLLVPMSVLVLVRLVSVFATPDLILGSFISFLRYLEWLLVFVIVVDTARAQDASNLVTLFLLIIGVQSIVSIAQVTLSVLGGWYPLARGGTLGETGVLLGWLQIYALLIGLSLAERSPTPERRVVWGAYTVLVVAGLLSTLGLTMWITALIAMALYHGLDRGTSFLGRARRAVRNFAALGVVMLGLGFASGPLLTDVILGRAQMLSKLGEFHSFNERLRLWRLGLDMFLQKPILGVGSGNYVDLLERLVDPEEVHTTHNAVIGVLSETGLLGFFAYLFFAGRLVATIRADLRKLARSRLYPLLLPLGSAIVALLLADWIGWTSFWAWSAFFLGLYVVLAREAHDERRRCPNLLPGERG